MSVKSQRRKKYYHKQQRKKQTNKQTKNKRKQTNKQTNKQTDRQTNRHTNIQKTQTNKPTSQPTTNNHNNNNNNNKKKTKGTATLSFPPFYMNQSQPSGTSSWNEICLPRHSQLCACEALTHSPMSTGIPAFHNVGNRQPNEHQTESKIIHGYSWYSLGNLEICDLALLVLIFQYKLPKKNISRKR